MYDIIILGGGPGGYLAAERAGHAGLKTALIEKNKLGGVCLNEGCIPSKTLLNSAKILDYARHGEPYGVTTTKTTLDQKVVVERKNKIVRSLVSGVKAQMKANHVTVYEGFGEILGKEKNLIRVKVGEEVLTAPKLLIATGSEAIILPIPGVKEGIEAGYVLTNREILDLTIIPQRLAVVGGGVIGLEMASYFSSAGAQVTVIEMLNKIAGPTDHEISSILQKNLERKGIQFKLEAKVTSLTKGMLEYEEGGMKHTLETDFVLLSVGRKPVISGFGLETLGIMTERGRIVVDEKGQTNVPGVFASGDVNGVWMLAHAAYRESEVIINNLTGKKDVMRYHSIPSVIYTYPEVGSVGDTEQDCIEKGIRYKAITIPMNYSGRYMAETEKGDGICKIIVDTDHHYMVGCHIIGSYASEIIVAAGMMIETEMRIEDIKEIVFPHPTVSEIIREAIFQI
jgi:dihydrolipoamide dehydrogenase